MSNLVSVVIPCRNERRHIGDCVTSILASDHAELEVIVVDGLSDDGTRDILRELAKDARVRVVDNPHKLTPFAFNLGILNAKGDYIQIVGSRNMLSPTYISTLKAALDSRQDVACVGGDYQHVYESENTKYLGLAMESPFGVGAGNYRTKTSDADVDTVGIPLYRKALFSEVGLFDETFTRNQDDELNYRARLLGYKIRYVHAAKATYLVRSSLGKAFRQFYQYGYFKVLANKKHRALTTMRQIVPALFVVSLATWLATFWASKAWLSIGLAMAALYCLLGIARAGPQLGMAERMRVLVACFTLHVAYGTGYLQGILDFILLGRRPRTNLQKQTV